ncbi:MAG: serine protease [Flavobacteriaceae bacterium]|nr:serine protease [Flavobacteriaceae bacterium]
MKNLFLCLFTLVFVGCAAIHASTKYTNNTNNFKHLEDSSVIVSCEAPTPKKWKERRPDLPDFLPASGSGTIIYHESGGSWYILTAAHVVKDCVQNFEISWIDHDGDHHLEIQRVGLNSRRDLAIYKTKATFSVQRTYVKLAKEGPSLGEEIYMAGYPGLTRPYFILTKGFIANAFATMEGTTIFLIDGQITFGNSGGASVNKNMELIGVNVVIVPEMFYGYQLGMAVHTDEIWKFIKKTDKSLYGKLLDG